MPTIDPNGADVVVTGTGFRAGIGAKFGGVDAESLSLESSTRLLARVPPGTPGASCDCVVTNSDGKHSAAFPLSYSDVIEPPSGVEVTRNSAIYHDLSDPITAIYYDSGNLNGSLDTTRTLPLTKNAGGSGIHALNAGQSTEPRYRSNVFKPLPGSISSTFTIALAAHPSDAAGGKIVIAICDRTGTVLATTVVTLTSGAPVDHAVTYATDPAQEYQAIVSVDPDLGADPGVRAYAGDQKVECAGASGIYADCYRIDLLPTRWTGNLETFLYSLYWAFTSGRGTEVSPFAFVSFLTSTPTLGVEFSSNFFADYAGQFPAGTGFTLITDANVVTDVKSSVDTVLERASVSLPGGAPSGAKLVAPGRNLIAAGWKGTLIRALYVPANASFVFRTPAARSLILAAFGNSITAGFNSTPAAIRAWLHLAAEALDATLFCDATGGNIAYAYSGANCDEEADKIASCDPDLVFGALGTNDWQQANSSGLNKTSFKGFIKTLVLALLARIKSTAKIVLFFIWNKTTYEAPTVNNLGETIDDYRTVLLEVIDEIASNRVFGVEVKAWTTYAGFVNDDYMAQAGNLNDLVHPNNSGHAKMGAKAALVAADTKLVISPSSPTVEVGQTQQFTASGGAGAPLTWGFLHNNSGGSISSSGLYTAGATGGVTDIIKCKDAHDQVTTRHITVPVSDVTPLTIAPTTASVSTGGSQHFTPSGGTGGYSWSLSTNASGGSVTNGDYTAGSTAGLDVVRVSDGGGSHADANVTVSAPPTLWTPPVQAGAVLRTYDFTVNDGTNLTVASGVLSGAVDLSGHADMTCDTNEEYAYTSATRINGKGAIGPRVGGGSRGRGGSLVSGLTAFSLAVVVELADLTGDNAVASFGAFAPAVYAGSAGHPGLYFGAYKLASQSLTVNQGTVLHFVRNGASLRMWINETEVDSFSDVNASATALALTLLHDGGVTSIKGKCGLWNLWGVALTPSEVATSVASLKSKFAIA